MPILEGNLVMFRKLVCILLIIFTISVFGSAAFAAPGESLPAGDNLTADAGDILNEIGVDAKDTKQFWVTITRPDEDTDSTYKSSYVISGVSNYTDVIVVLQVFDEDSGKYVPMENTDGESSWVVGSFNVFSKAAFSKEIELAKGANKIRILAYRTSQENDLKIADVQVNKFTVTLLDASIKDIIIRSIVDFTKLIFK